MNGRFIFSLLVCFILSACGNKPPEKKSAPVVVDSTRPKKIAVKDGLIEGIQFAKIQADPTINMMIQIGDTLLYCSKKGKIEIADTENNIRKLMIDLHAEYLVNKLYIAPCKNHKWFLSWEETNMEGIRSYAAVYSTDISKPEWKLSFRDPNPGKPVIDDDVVYISTLGRAAKVSLNGGTIIWQQDSLFSHLNLAYQQMDKALVYPDKIVFVDFPVRGIRDRLDSLILDPVSGKRKK